MERVVTKTLDFASADAWTAAVSHATAGGASAVIIVAVHMHTDLAQVWKPPASLAASDTTEQSTLFGGIHESRLRERAM